MEPIASRLTEGLLAFRAFMEMLDMAARGCGVQVRRRGQELWAGADLEGKKYAIGVYFSRPEFLRFETGEGWFRDLALASEEIDFFSRPKASQLQVLEEFIRESLALAKCIESPSDVRSRPMTTYERAFYAAIFERPDDDGPRLIYADWLEERGDAESLAKAEFIRLECSLAALKPESDDYARRKARMRELSQSLGLIWCAAVSKPALENCRVAFKFECPKKWEQLTLTGDPLVRFCESCRKGVHYCGAIQEAQEHAWAGHCVAVDCRVDRKPGDLDPPLVTLGMMEPLRARPALRSGRRPDRGGK
jgi:uncharacterized protein (TIGR02996 family)